MMIGFYSRLALEGMKKNHKLYVPYLMTCGLMVAMFYIICYLSESPVIRYVKGADTVSLVLGLGMFVIAVFAAIFLFYTHSFLIRRRNREFGLYNILGMSKGNISVILIWETVLTALISLATGLFTGILLSKLAELCIINLVQGEVTYQFTLNPHAALRTCWIFCTIFLVILLFSFGKVQLSKPLNLLKAELVGEKPPRANWVLALIGAVMLGGAYYLALSIKEPISAMILFFAAVLLVIVATYLLFIAGSTTLCKLLQKNRSYYYKSNHFVSVSSMTYRMKRNGAGLASICILLTMVLVMLSSTSCLYFGGNAAMDEMYAYDMYTTFVLPNGEPLSEEQQAWMEQTVRSAAGDRLKGADGYRCSSIAGLLKKDGMLEPDPAEIDQVKVKNYDNVRMLLVIPLEDYNRAAKENRTLKPGETMLYTSGKAYPYKTLTIGDGNPMTITTQLSSIPNALLQPGMKVSTCLYLIVPNYDEVLQPFYEQVNSFGVHSMDQIWQYCFDLDGDVDDQIEVRKVIEEALSENEELNDAILSYSINSCGEAKLDFLAMYGSLFFLGVLLSIVFIVAAVLIIYYKQISEGYEDQKRFAIMQNVGMTKTEIRRSINSQVLTVFFAPLAMSVLHLCFAFPMIWRILVLLGVSDLKRLILVNVAVCVALGAFYAAVYRITSNVYYGIVSGIKE